MGTSVSIDGNYEVVRVVCPVCTKRIVFNRRSDLDDLSSIAHKKVVCLAPECGAPFTISGDTVGPAYKMFYYEAYDFVKDKRYSFAVLSVAQALEVFFAHAVRELWLLKPFDVLHRGPGDLEALNSALTVLYEKTAKFPYEKMRNLFFHAALLPRPTTVAQGRQLVDAITEKYPTPSNEVLAAAPGRLGSLLLALKMSSAHELRNRVVHQRAYRPSREEAEQAVKAVGDVLVPLASTLDVEFDSF